MAKVKVFTSFDWDHDVTLRDFLVGQGKLEQSPFEIADWSVREEMTGDWKAKVRDRIAQVSQIAVICGKHTDTATGVSAEIVIAREIGKPYFLLAGYKEDGNKKPKAALATDKMYKWTWDNLKKLIAGGR